MKFIINNGNFIFYILTIVSIITLIVGFSYFGSNFGIISIIFYLLAQGTLTIWMLRDLRKRKFDSNSEVLNWAAAITCFGVIGTIIYFVKIKRNSPVAEVISS
ncbi:MAG: hypothetical protein GWO07_01905 [Candidatus Dadabacteria bacterium]|nr:hypothetical protein [Candidatus Dadabacteria bacterium]NIV41924.1 hypothetical protein [Candidatus Dadabacteria bacterium]NIX14675.1 hypothetical protein [Candidatus Dadabacteria bacterium]